MGSERNESLPVFPENFLSSQKSKHVDCLYVPRGSRRVGAKMLQTVSIKDATVAPFLNGHRGC